MLDLWRSPQGSGDPAGCLTTTYTFGPSLLDEQCLARFLDIDSEPNRESLAFLLEREDRLGGVYVGVLVDRVHAGVEHSLRWDVLPVRVPQAKQHAKLTLLAWTRCIRIIVTSANLTEAGYRTNQEVAATVDLTPQEADTAMLADAIGFLRRLIALVPGAADGPPEVTRAGAFLSHVEVQAAAWKAPRRSKAARSRLVFTLPGHATGGDAQSSLDEAVGACRRRGGSPSEAWIASPFFDPQDGQSKVTAALCKSMARGGERHVRFCVPGTVEGDPNSVRLGAPRALLDTSARYGAAGRVAVLPARDEDGNHRPWHAKMLALRTDAYSALMVGSSNFTCAGMGVGAHRNAEANLVTIVDRVEYGRDAGQLMAVWPAMEAVADPEAAEWLGALPGPEEEEAADLPIPQGFLSATFRAGDSRQILLRLHSGGLPPEWAVYACGRSACRLLGHSEWVARGGPAIIEIDWGPPEPPARLRIHWDSHEGFLPLNVEDGAALPPPVELQSMSADDLLWILSASDPGAAVRAWLAGHGASEDADLDSAIPPDLDPLRRYDLRATFLHRVRHRARMLAQLRAKIERPVWSRQALDGRLHGLIGVEPLADRLLRELEGADGDPDERLLAIADLLIVLREVDYRPELGALPKTTFDELYHPFLNDLAAKADEVARSLRDRLARDVTRFWERVVAQCVT